LKTAIIATLGLSPPVITSFIEGFNKKVNDLILLTTRDLRVKSSFELIRISLKLRYPDIYIHEVEIPFNDISTTNQNLEFMAICAKSIRKQREIYNTDRIYLNISGGRKNMCITLSLLGQLLAVDGVYHIVAKDIKIVNTELERLQREIQNLYKLDTDDDKIDYYKQYEKEFNDLLFPPKSQYDLIRIPTLPYPASYLSKILNIIDFTNLSGPIIDINNLNYDEKELLYRHDILQKIGNRYKISDYGKKIIEILVKPIHI